MGPRSRRRLAGAATAVTAIGVIVAAILITRSSSKPSAAPPTTPMEPATLAAAAYPTFGMTPNQVKAIVGPPMKIKENCWLFRPHAGSLNGLPTRSVGPMMLGDPGSIAARSNGLVKLCFYAGTFSTASQQTPFEGRLVWRDFNPGGPVESSGNPSPP